MLPRNHLICIWHNLSAMFPYLLATSQIPNTSFLSSLIPVDYVFYFSEKGSSNRNLLHRPAGPSSILTHTFPLAHGYIHGSISSLRPSLCALDSVYSHLLKTVAPTILSLPASLLVYFFLSVTHLFANPMKKVHSN